MKRTGRSPSCAAARGTTDQATAAAPIATTSSRTTGSAISVSIALGLKLCVFTFLPFIAEGEREFFSAKIAKKKD
jgi:hypothetical protein